MVLCGGELSGWIREAGASAAEGVSVRPGPDSHVTPDLDPIKPPQNSPF